MAADFTKLRIWNLASDLTLEVYSLTSRFPVKEKYSLTGQLRRSSNSVAANIAESTGRYFKKDKIRTLYVARGEAQETKSHLIIAGKLKYCNPDQTNDLVNKYNELAKQINSFINYLSSQK